MNAGLPTTGIASIFYFISVVFMFINECINTIRNKSNIKRWRLVTKQIFITLSIIFAVVVTGYFLKIIIPAKEISQVVGINTSEGIQKNTTLIFLSPFIILTVLISLTQIFRLFLKIKKKS